MGLKLRRYDGLKDLESQELKKVFNEGSLIVYPTETLYALGVNPFDENALEKVFEVKRRPRNMPISVAVSDIEMMSRVAYVNTLAEDIYEHFLPGPVTLVLKKRECVPSLLVGGRDKVGIRVPKHSTALKIIATVGPITSTSANVHGHPEPKNLDIAREQLYDNVTLYFDGGECEYKSASTIVDISNSSIKIIRKGVVAPEKLIALFE